MQNYRLEGQDGGLDRLAMREEAVLQPGPRQILVRVRATSLNRRDTMILNGTYPLT
ncbi:NAD(P)-dependent alcohol dehydrogenase, partial [Mesorhizobium sp. M2D.F.Ca.ET.145.01.1.1]